MSASRAMKRSCRSLPGIVALTLLSVAAAPSNVRAGFVIQEIETFDGNQVDTTTWEPLSYTSNRTPISQQDCLIFNDWAQYMTADVTVGVGDTVSVQLLEHPTGNSTSSLYLTTRTGQSHFIVGYESPYVYLEYSYMSALKDYAFIAGRGGNKTGMGMIFGRSTPPPLPGRPLTLQIQRVTEYRCVSSVYDSNMVLIGEPQTCIFSDLKEDAKLYVCLAAWPQKGGRTVFDNVKITRAKPQLPAKPSDAMDTLSQLFRRGVSPFALLAKRSNIPAEAPLNSKLRADPRSPLHEAPLQLLPIANPQLDWIPCLREFCRCCIDSGHAWLMVTGGEYKIVLRGDTRDEQVSLINS